MKRKRRFGCLVFFIVLILLIAAGIALYCTIDFSSWNFSKKISSENMHTTMAEPHTTNSTPTAAPALAFEDGGYYYSQLDEMDRQTYADIYRSVCDLKKSFVVGTDAPQSLSTLCQSVLMDHPELFWFEGNFSQKYIDGMPYANIEPVYTVAVEDVPRVRSEIEAQADQVISGITTDTNDPYTIVKRIYEYVIQNNDYRLDSEQNQNIQSCFLHHVSVCAGYAKTFQYLLTRAGINCIYVEGTATNAASHAWNIIEINGQHYEVDCTWGDPNFSEDSSYTGDTISYDYLCITDTEMNRTHTPNASYTYPICSQNDLDYYRQFSHYMDVYDEDEMLSILSADAARGDAYTTIKFFSETDYQTAVSRLFTDGLIDQIGKQQAKSMGLAQYSYSYSCNNDIYIVKIYW